MVDSWGLTGGEEIAPGLTAVKDLGGGIVYEAWLAFDDRLHSPVVAKVLRPGHVDDVDSRAGFDREIDLLSRLNHPSVVRLYSFDDQAERPYLVMENIDGPNLSRLISGHGALQPHQLLPLGLELAAALHYLRGEDVCHLDIKPSNVMMGSAAKLIDFSLAMDGPTAASLDHPAGSDEYMAPEQCEPGTRGVPGAASDMWAFGATMFRAAAGFRAFDREPRWAQLHDAPTPLPDAVPAALADLLMRCLSHDPGARPEPVEAAEVIEPLLATLPSARLAGFSLRR